MVESAPPLRPELFIGIIGPIGSDVDLLIECLSSSFELVGYQTERVHLMECISEFTGNLGIRGISGATLWKRYESKMDMGNAFRRALKLDDAAVRAGITYVREYRGLQSSPRRKARKTQGSQGLDGVAYVFRQLKTKGEVALLRETYGSNAIIVSAYSPKQAREDSLTSKFAASQMEPTSERHRAHAISLIARDQDELDDFGQNIQGAFPLGDVFIDTGAPEKCRDQVKRFIEILFKHPVRTPRRDELGMYYAHGAALRSADPGRQVGAAICEPGGEVVSLGTNEVPCPGGGQYWEEDDESHDNRDWKRPMFSNSNIVRGLLSDLMQRLRHFGWLESKKCEADFVDAETMKDLEDLITAPIRDKGAPESLRDKAQLKNVIEFFRAVHAEMAAIISSARRGASIDGATMYVTTFPCHECGKHIVASGIKRVVFIEPYPKSRVPDLYSDSISIDRDEEEKVIFSGFVGIAPRRFLEWFIAPDRRKDGEWIDWEKSRVMATPRNATTFRFYAEAEDKALNIFEAKMNQVRRIDRSKKRVKRGRRK